MKKCLNCTLQFKKSSYYDQNLCSRKCKGEYAKKINIITKECPICKNEFTCDKRKEKTVCSVQCQHAYQKTESVIKKSRAKIKKTLLKKHEVEHNSQISGFTDKVRKTKLEKYGEEWYTNRNKAQQTMIDKYGSTTYNNKEKIQQTMMERYGVSAFSQSPLFKEKLLEKYGVDHPLHTPKNKKRMYEKVISKLVDISPKFDFDQYDGVHSKTYEFECNTCHTTFMSTLDDGNIPICRVCHPQDKTKSKCEYEIIEWIKSFYNGNIIHGDKTILLGKELDIYLPELSLAIELNGLYFHGEITGKKNKQYHLIKTKMCSRNGITLLHILDIEWIHKKKIIQSILFNRIMSDKTEHIHGRKCIIQEVTPIVANKFLNKNHIQGEDKSSIRIGLFYKDELVSLLTFGKNRFNKETELEMYRFCNKINTNVQGGLEKLFKYFVKTYQPKSILTFSDRRFFTGQTYSKIGFILVAVTPPNYHYFKINNHNTIFSSRNKFQKHKLHKLLENFDPSLTEWQNMQLNGYDRIWDCGNTKWIWINGS